jgi:hypothetical protein
MDSQRLVINGTYYGKFSILQLEVGTNAFTVLVLLNRYSSYIE